MKKIWVLIFFSFVFVVFFLPTLAQMNQVGGLFAEARYDEARQLLGSEETLPSEDALWRSRLTRDPNSAEEFLKESLKNSSLPETTRQGVVLQLAQIHFARGDYKKAHVILNDLITRSDIGLPGEVYLLAGLTERTAGNLQVAREMLASVKPGDQAFGTARYYLGDIGLENNDPELALRYFESGQKNSTAEDYSRLKAGQWRAMRIAGRDQDAASVLIDLERTSPGSLALVEIGRVLQLEEDENSARVAANLPSEPDTVVTAPTDNSGRYSLQVGAFSDRSLALEFKERHQNQISGLTITEVRDQRGQFLYKIRFGSFVNPALARSEAQRQKRKLGIDVIVVELTPADRNN